MKTAELFELKGKVALITGGSRGLGLQIAEGLGEMGCKVAITARKADELAEAAKHLSAKGIENHIVVNDLSKLADIPAMVEAVVKRLGDIDILVNNAGATWGAKAEEYPDEAWRKVMTLNIDAMFHLSREVGRRCMIPRKTGKIVNVASIAGLRGGPSDMHTIAYNTSKGAAVNFTRALASEWGPHGINVNAICPGFFPTKMASGILERVGDRVIKSTPLRRLGGDEDLKGVAVFLASDAARHITGQCIAVDGGQSSS
ncbi:MAG TPA: SDR family oxidoreductase [Usitatibacter sp.]|nr:SDR family oxidoreductase [Usitatibacter sp.]HST02821.1 SDR family oxidoreductase [Usitatibacter sp.]